MLRVRANDAEAFAELVQRHQQRLIAWMTHVVGRRDLAEDLAQDVFLRIYKARGRYVPGSKFSTWMYTIARNVALGALRSRARNKEFNLVAQDSGAGEVNPLAAQALAASGLMPTRQLATAELGEVVRLAVSELSERQRMAVLLNKFEHLSYEEIAEVMEMTPAAIKSLLTRARANLREVLAPYLRQGLFPTRDDG